MYIEDKKGGEVIPFEKPAKVIRSCSFCGKQEHHVHRMVSNNQEGKEERNICNECINKATGLLK